METIEERSNKCAYDLRAIGHDFESVVRDAYVRGATEQLKIDIEKGCDFMYNFTLPNGVAPLYDYTGNFRKAMDE